MLMRQTPRADRKAKRGLHLCLHQIPQLACYVLSGKWAHGAAPHTNTDADKCAAA